MPNWKKLIVSGSDASLNSLNVTNNVTAQSFTGSFSGSFTAPGATTQVVYNSGGVLSADSGFVYSGSRVGIGTITPTATLHVSGSGRITGDLIVSGSTLNRATKITDSGFYLSRTSEGSYVSSITADGTMYYDTRNDHVFKTDGTENLRIVNSTGNVGIGTTSPSQKLHVEGSAKVRDAIYLGGNTDVISASSISGFMTIGSNQPIRFTDAGSTEFLRITTGGNVGIGTTTPATKLALAGSTATTFGLSLEPAGWNTAKHRLTVPISGDVSMWSFNWDGSSVDSALYAPASILLSQGTVTFNTTGSANSPAPRMTINSVGNVGIGTTNPSSILEISQATPTVRIGSSDVTQFHGIEFLNGGNLDAFIKQLPQTGEFKISNGRGTGWGGHITLYTDTTERMRITAAGNVGIGTTSPSQKLTVVGNTSISGVTYTDYVQTYSGTSIDFRHQDASTVMRVDTANARVGIGTTSPTATLEVNGNVKAISFTGSFSGSITHAVSASYALSSSYALTATTASYALTASFINPLNQNLIVTGSVIATGGVTASNALITGNLTVVGTASFNYTTASIVNVGAATITLNTDNPAVRFGGITVVDSGSFGTSSTGSLLWDSQNNRWVYSNPSGSTYDGGLLISGPRNTSGLGNEEGTTLNALMKGQGGDHITSSGVFEVSGSVGIGTSSPSYKLDVQGDVGIGVAGATTVHAYYNSTTRNQNVYTNNSSFEFHEGVNERVRIAAGGNVGIGTSSPESISNTTTLTVNNSSVGGGAVSFQVGGVRTGLLNGNDNYLTIQSYASRPLSLGYNGTNTIVVNTSNNVGIGTTSPTEKLHVVGKIRLEDTYFQSNNPATYPNFAIGTSNFTSTVTGYGNIGFGYEALSLLTSGRYNVAAGYTALANVTTGQANVALGPFALRQTTTGTYNIGIGDDALTNNINGSYNIGFGSSALENNINGEENIGIGEGAIQASKHGSYNIAMGYYALNYLTNTTSSYNIGIGYLSGGNLAGGIHNTYLGNNLHVVSTGSYNVFIGGNIAVNALGFSSATKSVVIADNSGSVKIFADSTGSVGIGTVTPSAKLEVSGNVKATSFTGSFSGSVSAPGSTTQIVYNDNGILAATSSLVYSGSNVGIGISAPTERLHIVGSTSGNQFARITATDSDSSAAWVAQNDSGDNVVYRVFSSGVIGTQMSNALSRSASLLANLGGSGVFLLGTFSNTNFVLGTNNTERMRITNGGNVGIGTTSPGAKLHVASGEIRVDAGQAVTLDTSNSMYLVGASSQLRLYNGGNPIVNITTGGNVGIGTTSPSEKLHVVGDVLISDSSPSLIFTDTTNNADAIIYTLDDGSLAFSADENNEVAGSKLLFYVDGGEKVRITDGGNVGIGTSSPSYKLDVVGATNTAGLYSRGANIGFESQIAALGTNGSYQAGYYLGATNTVYAARLGMDVNSGDVYLGIGNTGSLSTVTYFKANGNVGIGTTSPSARLHISGSTDATQRIIADGSGNNSSLHLNYNGSNVGFINSYQNSELNIGTSVSAFVNLYTNNTERMRITSAGDVGIGNTSPNDKLDVSGNVSANAFNAVGTLARYNGTGGVAIAGLGGSSYAYIKAYSNSGGTGKNLALQQDGGNVGIGTTSPAATLHTVGNNIVNIVESTSSVSYTQYYNSSTGNGGTNDGLTVGNNGVNAYIWQRESADLLLGTSNTEALRISSTQNVGIGTSSPSQKLSVVGAVSASTYYGDGSNLTNIGSGSVSAAGSDGQIQYNNSGLFGGASRLYYNDSTNRVGIGTSSPGYDLDVSGSVRVQDRLRVGAVNSGNGVVHQSSDATINPSSATTVWTISGTAGICAFIEYYLINNNTGTSQRAGTVVTTWNAAGSPQITHTETSTPDVGSTGPITLSTTITLGGDPQLIATNTGGDTWYMVMNYRYF